MPLSEHRKPNRLARRIYPARVLGLSLGFVAISAALYPLRDELWFWVFAVTYCFAWPHIAYLWATRVSDSLETGHRQLLVDSFFGGIWLAAMQFNLLPSVLIVTMLTMNNLACGGVRLFLYGLLAQLISVIAGIAIFGWSPQIHSTLLVTITCLPMLICYPLTIGIMIYQFAVRIHQQKVQLKQLSRTDGLTGLYNRRFWQNRAMEEFSRCQRSQHRAVVFMLDIDHFKNINDTYGHSTGDAVIRGIADVLKRQLRNIDISGRYGGEEFTVVLPDIDLAEGRQVAERLRADIANELFGEHPGVGCTISLGLAEYHPQMASCDSWIKAADDALYKAKNLGRNQVCWYVPPTEFSVVDTPAHPKPTTQP